MINWNYKSQYDINDLVDIVEILRSPEGCPWDREQTHESIERGFIEETYEVIEAIGQKNTDHLKEELGDVLLQVVFHSQIEREKGTFQLNDVANDECKKLIYRHPHVFGNVQVSGSDQVLENWDQLKRKEKSQETHTDALQSVARSLPSLWRAEKVQGKARKAGFDWPDMEGPLNKIDEELDELKTALRDQTDVEEELGDLLFAIVNLARFADVDCEKALHSATEKFIQRFSAVESLAVQEDKPMESMSLEELDALWEKAKDSSL